MSSRAKTASPVHGIPEIRRLYVDASSLIRMVTGDHDGVALKAKADGIVAAGAELVSSRLLVLEVERTAVRLETLENRDATPLRSSLDVFAIYPLSEEVWRAAFGIRRHIKTLDALHVATCSFLPDSALLTSDRTMREVAEGLGIKVA